MSYMYITNSLESCFHRGEESGLTPTFWLLVRVKTLGDVIVYLFVCFVGKHCHVFFYPDEKQLPVTC